jgi:hypothetical protein
MIILLFILLSSVQSFADTPANDLCTKNSNCVLFENECHELLAITISELPHDTEKYKHENNFDFYSLTDKANHGCSKIFTREPMWPKKPKARCVKNRCKIIPS